MAINTLEFTTLMQTNLDQHIVAGAVTGFMEAVSWMRLKKIAWIETQSHKTD